SSRSQVMKLSPWIPAFAGMSGRVCPDFVFAGMSGGGRARVVFFAGMWGWACRRVQYIPLIPAQAGIQQQISGYEIVAVDPRFRGDEREGVPGFCFSRRRAGEG